MRQHVNPLKKVIKASLDACGHQKHGASTARRRLIHPSCHPVILFRPAFALTWRACTSLAGAPNSWAATGVGAGVLGPHLASGPGCGVRVRPVPAGPQPGDAAAQPAGPGDPGPGATHPLQSSQHLLWWCNSLESCNPSWWCQYGLEQ